MKDTRRIKFVLLTSGEILDSLTDAETAYDSALGQSQALIHNALVSREKKDELRGSLNL